jgi:hypothetical protein
MFGQRQRNNKNIGKGVQQSAPQAEPNVSRLSAPPEMDEPNTLPAAVTEVMSVVRLSWDFMTHSEVFATDSV